MIDLFRKNRFLTQIAMGLFTLGLVMSLFAGGSSSPGMSGKRRISPQKVQTYAASIKQTHPHISEEQAQTIAYHHQVSMTQLFNRIESYGLIPSKKSIVQVSRQISKDKQTLEKAAKARGQSLNDMRQEMSDELAYELLKSSIQHSAFSAKQQREFRGKLGNQVQHITDLNLSKIKHSTDHKTLEAFYKAMQDKPSKPSTVKLNYIQILPEDVEPTQADILAIQQANPALFDDSVVEYEQVILQPGKQNTQAPEWVNNHPEANAFMQANPNYNASVSTSKHNISKAPSDVKTPLQTLKTGNSTIVSSGNKLTLLKLKQKATSGQKLAGSEQTLYNKAKESVTQVAHQKHLQAVRRHAFKNPDSLNELAKHFGIKATTYQGIIPEYLSEEALSADWAKKGYISDVISHDNKHYLVQVEQHIPAKALRFEQCISDVNEAYKQRIVLPKLLQQLKQDPTNQRLINTYHIPTKKLTLENETLQLFNNTARIHAYEDDSGDLHISHLDSVSYKDTETQAADLEPELEGNLLVRMLLK